jgi:hypothetical protein
MDLKHQVLSNAVIDLNATEVHGFGPDLRLENCTINSRCAARSLIMSDMEMVGGAFNQKKALTNYQFNRVIFQGVKFTGKYDGCSFGNHQESLQGKALDCDFSEAKLHDSSLYECPPDRVRFPVWPCFSIVNPRLAQEYVLSQTWPAKLGSTMKVYTGVSPRCTVIFANAAELGKQYGVAEDVLRKQLESVPGIVIID